MNVVPTSDPKRPITTRNIDPYILEIYRSKTKSTDRDHLEEYLHEEVEEQDVDVLEFWKSKRFKWPRLSIMARDYLAVTATSASSEREFSIGRDLLGICRNSLAMQACICLRSWMRGGFVNDNSNNEHNVTVHEFDGCESEPSEVSIETQ